MESSEFKVAGEISLPIGGRDEKWEGEYGWSRMRLLSFMIDSLTAFLLAEQAQPPVTSANYKPAHGGYPGTVR